MKSGIDPIKQNVSLLTTRNLEEVADIIWEIVSQEVNPQAMALLIWDPDLEAFSDRLVFGSKKSALCRFLDKFTKRQVEADHLTVSEIDVAAFDEALASELSPIVSYRLEVKGKLCGLILCSGIDESRSSDVLEKLSRYSLAPAVAHCWEFREIQQENQRLRNAYEELEDRTRSMEEQTMKLIHDVKAKEALHTNKIDRERVLYQVSNTVRSSLAFNTVGQTAVNEIGRVLKVSRCLILRQVDETSQVMVFEYHHENVQPVKELFATEEGMRFTRLASKRNAPQDLGDPNHDDQSPYDRGFLSSMGTRSGLIIPLILREAILGVLFLQECTHPRQWSVDDIVYLNSLADQLSVAIENAELHEERERQARTDGLTGLYNRRHFNQALTRELERATRYNEPLSLILVDMDNLKMVNDTYGHQVGDEAIKTISRIMQQSSRSIDLAARYGGEEFCLLLPNTDLAMAEQIAERLRRLINETNVPGAGTISASIGIASYPEHASDPDILFDRADQALYEAKRAGKNQVALAGRTSKAKGPSTSDIG